MIEMSADTVELFKALVAFQAECPSPTKTSTNPHFKNRYAPLDVVLETVQPYLTKNGLTVNQFPCGATPGMVGVVTQIGHVSGQWMRCAFSVNITKNDPQMAGSGISYARRYAVLAALNLAAEDDDGESATRDKPQAKQSTTERLNAIASGGERAERPLPGAKTAVEKTSSPATASRHGSTRGGDPVPVAKVIESVGAQTPGDGDLWLQRNNRLAEAAYEFSGIPLGEMDDMGLVTPSVPCPKFSAKAKMHSGKSYNDPSVPAGFLREVILADPRFGDQPIATQLHVMYRVARHEIMKGHHGAE